MRSSKKKMMNEKEFKELIKRFEEEEKADPIQFKNRLIKMLALGYSYFFLVLVGLISALFITIVFIIPFFLVTFLPVVLFLVVSIITLLGATIVAIFKSIFIKFEKPKGVEVRRKDAPDLFEVIDKYTSLLKSSKIHKVYLNNDMNVSVYQRPMLGIFGFFKNYIIIGMPVFMLLSKTQFESVLAHEIGHISKSHGRFFRLVYRMREPWTKLVNGYEMYDTFLYRRFYYWFLPRLSAMTFVISRASEYDADAKAAKLTDSRSLLDSLALIDILNEYKKESFWEDYYRNVIAFEKPIPIYSNMEDFFNKQIPKERFVQLFQQVLNIKTDYYDTHPSFSDRAKGVSFKPELPQVAKVSAAKEMLKKSNYTYTDLLEELWFDEVKLSWEIEREERLDMIEKLSELDNIMKVRPLTEVEASDRAFWVEKIYGIDKAYPMYQDVLDKNSFNPVANFFIGRKLILSGNPLGIKFINVAVERDLEAVIPGTELIYNFLLREGKKDEADRYYKDNSYRRDLYYRLEYYRNSISYYDDLRLPDLPKVEIKKIRDKFLKIDEVREAYLFTKEVADMDIKVPIFIVFVKMKWNFRRNKDKDEIVYKKLQKIMPKNTIICNMKYIKGKEYNKFLRGMKEARMV